MSAVKGPDSTPVEGFADLNKLTVDHTIQSLTTLLLLADWSMMLPMCYCC